MFYVKLSSFLGIYTGTLSCIAKLPNELCASHTKRAGDKRFAEVLRTGFPFKNI